MEMYRGELSRMLFDHEHPTVTWAKEHYKEVDISDRHGMTGSDIADAIYSLKENQEMLILPERRYYGGKPFKHKFGIIPLDNPTWFRKFGPEINMVRYGTTIRETKENKVTPRKAFRQTISDPQIREKLKTGMYRGLGYWSIRAKERHNIIWFDVLAEGQAFFSLLNPEFATKYQFADAYQVVPSYKQITGVRQQEILVLPVTERDGEYFVEWHETFTPRDCLDSFFMGSKSKKKEHNEFESIFKYSSPERIICRHGFSQILQAEEKGDEPCGKKLLVKWPRAKGGKEGYMTFWKKSKTQVYIRDGSGIRRPLKPEIGRWCQYDLGNAVPDEAFDLSEEELKLAA